MNREKLIEKYVQGQLSESEEREFGNLLKNDLDFKKEVEFHVNLKKVAEAEDDDHFRGIMKDFESDISTEKIQSRNLPTKWLVAASIAVLLVLSYLFIFNQTPGPQELFNRNFEPYENVVAPTIRSSAEDSPKKEAFEAYQIADYEKAAQMFPELYEETGEAYYLFYTANALLELNRAAEAIPLLQEHLTSKDKLSNYTHWYLAMAYLQIADVENAKIMLQKVVDGNENEAERAKKLLRSLK
ncbi:MAG: hypothetical protein KJN76_03620 [Eudoraea sp.]|nr:hypothetical protein [Eudoraea sp.]